jgi:hypothetical protein
VKEVFKASGINIFLGWNIPAKLMQLTASPAVISHCPMEKMKQLSRHLGILIGKVLWKRSWL